MVLGYEDAAGYENGTAAIGAIVGRNANRIGGACVTINGIDYKLAENDGKIICTADRMSIRNGCGGSSKTGMTM